MGRLVIVTGAPAAGKTTLTGPLGERLGLPVIAKDVIKEALFDSLGTGDRAWSDRLSVAAYSVMFALARGMDEVLLEANFTPAHRPLLGDLPERPIEVYCWSPPEELARRHANRRRHPGHLDHEGPPPPREVEPVNLGPVLEVDTSGTFDVDAIAEWVRDSAGKDERSTG